MTDNELLATTEVEIFTFGGGTPGIVPGDVPIEPVDPVTLLVIPVDEVLPAVAPEPVPMCYATEGGASFPVGDYEYYAALWGPDSADALALFHLVPYDASIYG